MRSQKTGLDSESVWNHQYSQFDVNNEGRVSQSHSINPNQRVKHNQMKKERSLNDSNSLVKRQCSQIDRFFASYYEKQRMKKIQLLEKQLFYLKKQSQINSYPSTLEQSQVQSKKQNKRIIDLQSDLQTRIYTKTIQNETKLNVDKRQDEANSKLQQIHKLDEIIEVKTPLTQKIQKFNSQPKRYHRRHKVISKRTLQLLCKRFQPYYAFINHKNYKGPPISLQELSEYFDISLNNVQELYKEWLEDPTFYDRIVKHDLFKRTPQQKLSLQRLQHVSRLIKENPFLTLNEICVELNKIEDLKSLKEGQRMEITKTTVARLLKIGKYKKKRVRTIPKQRNTAKQIQRRYEFCAKYKQLLDKRARIYFLDQSGFNLYMIRQKAWARPNEEITVNCPISKGKRFSLIAIIGQDGVAQWRIIDGNYRKYEYLDFIRELFQKLYDRKDEQHSQNWLIMDNCSIHDKEETMKLAGKWNIKVMYLPAYTPQFNPIQMWFHELKTKVRKINYSSERQLLQIMERTLKQYQDHDFSNYYHGSLKFIEKGLRKERF